jgi:hypothetical protein
VRLEAFLCRYAEIIMTEFGRCVIRTGDEALAPGNRTEFRKQKREVDTYLRQMTNRRRLTALPPFPTSKSPRS